MRRNYFVTSFFSKENIQKMKQAALKKSAAREAKGYTGLNAERREVVKLLAAKQKRVIITAPTLLPVREKAQLVKFVELLKESTGNRQVRIKWLQHGDHYNYLWQRDTSVMIAGKRVLDKRRITDSHLEPPKKETAYFGEGGKLIHAGKKFGKEVVIVSSTPPFGDTGKKNPKVQSDLAQERARLESQGHKVFELPGFEYKRFGRLEKGSQGEFFDHIDSFVNTIPGKKVMVVDPDYYKLHGVKVKEIAKYMGFKIIQVPESEKFSYPSNFLNLGNGEIILDKSAVKTAKALRANGVIVYSTPRELKGNNQLMGGVRCFVNEA